MHHALQIPEILLLIFKYVFYPPPGLEVLPDTKRSSDIVALARTCRTFKEPALDILWSVLNNLSALGRCIPGAHNPESPVQQNNSTLMFYRALTQEEWAVLRSYTRRIRTIKSLDLGFSPVLDRVPENFFEQDLLFPNLRELNFFVLYEVSPWIHHQHIPSLKSINITSAAVGRPRFIRDHIALFSELYPNLTKIIIKGVGIDSWSRPDRNGGSVYTWPFKDLRVLECPDFKLETGDLKQLSRLPSLIKLGFALSNAEDIIAALSSERSTLVFPSLKSLKLSYHCPSLESTSKFLAQVELPVVEQLVVHADSCLVKHIGPFLSTVLAACDNRAIRAVRLIDISLSKIAERLDHMRGLLGPSGMQALGNWTSQRSLILEDLQPSMAFSNIRHVEIDIAAYIRLTDGALLELASAWPFLERLSINETTGWNHPLSVDGGITLNGLHQLLLKCPLLNHIGLVIYTPKNTAEVVALSEPITGLNSRSNIRGTFYINVMDSVIEAGSIPIIAAFLACIVRPYDSFKLEAWNALTCRVYLDTETDATNRYCWNQVRKNIHEILLHWHSEGMRN